LRDGLERRSVAVNPSRNANTKTDAKQSGADKAKRRAQVRQQVGSLRVHHPSPDGPVQGSRGARLDETQARGIFGPKCAHRVEEKPPAVRFFQCVAEMQLASNHTRKRG
jgi:hypothetical protein